jgi:hypothetical protein|tara:strand:- start:5812 stop:5994 length:183 start_codon:yes stop_codon:yes gene_type:complete
MSTPEQLEIQRRSIAMLPQRSTVTITMTVIREVAIDVLDYAKVLVRITSDTETDEDQAVA